MRNLYYAQLVDNAEEFTEEWTLTSGYENPPSTNLHYECRQARDAFTRLSNKLNHSFHGECYYVNLEGYERKRWELEFDRLYENYLDAMEAWIGDRSNIKSQIEPGINFNLPEFNIKRIIIGLCIAIGLSTFLSFIFDNSKTELEPRIQTTENK